MQECLKDANTKMSPIAQEGDRLESAVQELEREVERLTQKLHPVLCDPAPAEVAPQVDTGTTCEISSKCRGISDRVSVQMRNVVDLIERCQL